MSAPSLAFDGYTLPAVRPPPPALELVDAPEWLEAADAIGRRDRVRHFEKHRELEEYERTERRRARALSRLEAPITSHTLHRMAIAVACFARCRNGRNDAPLMHGTARLFQVLTEFVDWKTGERTTTLATLASRLNLSERTVRRCLAELVRVGVIRRLGVNTVSIRLCFRRVDELEAHLAVYQEPRMSPPTSQGSIPDSRPPHGGTAVSPKLQNFSDLEAARDPSPGERAKGAPVGRETSTAAPGFFAGMPFPGVAPASSSPASARDERRDERPKGRVSTSHATPQTRRGEAPAKKTGKREPEIPDAVKRQPGPTMPPVSPVPSERAQRFASKALPGAVAGPADAFAAFLASVQGTGGDDG